jgi:uncharacterized protein
MKGISPHAMALALAILLVPSLSALAQVTSPPVAGGPRYIRVTGEASVTSQPDQVQMEIGVVTQAPQADAAASQNAEKVTRVLAAIRKELGASAAIKTVNYSLNPNYTYPREGGEPTINGYMAMNTVRITSSDMSKIGRVIDVATAAGANNIQSLNYMLKDEGTVRADALREASRKARSQADAIASSLGLKVVGILSVEEGGARYMPMMRETRTMGGGAAPTNLEPGSVEVFAMVTLTVEVSG